MVRRGFPAPYDKTYEQEIALLTSARAALAKLDYASDEDRQKIEDMIAHLDQLFLLVVVGEFNSGKSSVINALLQDDYLPVGILPTTSKINILRHGLLKGSRTQDSIITLTHPSALLENLSIVDTPGSNAIFRQHEQLARDFVHRADFVLFVISATHAFAETDRLYLELIRQYGPKVVILLNQIDLLADDRELRQVEDFIRGQCAELLDFKPDIYPVSAKWAAESQGVINPGRRRKLWEESGIPKVLDFINKRLNEEARLKEKLRTPLRVAQAVLSRGNAELSQRRALLEQDFAAIAGVEIQEKAYQQMIGARLEAKLDRLERVFWGMRDRGEHFIDENLQLRNVMQVLNRQDFQSRFERAVVGDAPDVIARQIGEIVSELLAEDRKQWQETLKSLRQMMVRHQEQVGGALQGEFLGSLEAFEENVRQAEQALVRYSKQDAADSLRDIQMGALTDTIVTGISGLIGGVIMVTLLDDLIKALIALQAGSALSAVLGPAGWVLGGAAALGGSAWLITRRLPKARTQAKKELENQLVKLRSAFQEALKEAAAKEFTLFRNQVYGALVPVQQYLTRLRIEQQESQAQINNILGEIVQLQEQLDN